MSYVLFCRKEDRFGLGFFYNSEIQGVSRDNPPSSNKENIGFPVSSHYPFFLQKHLKVWHEHNDIQKRLQRALNIKPGKGTGICTGHPPNGSANEGCGIKMHTYSQCHITFILFSSLIQPDHQKFSRK